MVFFLFDKTWREHHKLVDFDLKTPSNANSSILQPFFAWVKFSTFKYTWQYVDISQKQINFKNMNF